MKKLFTLLFVAMTALTSMADALLNRMEPGDALLVKASRGMALEKVLEIFYKEQKDAKE